MASASKAFRGYERLKSLLGSAGGDGRADGHVLQAPDLSPIRPAAFALKMAVRGGIDVIAGQRVASPASGSGNPGFRS